MRLAAAVALLLATTACTTMKTPTAPTTIAPLLTSPDALDTATYAQPQVARVTHVGLDLALDFAAKTLGGTATLDVLATPDARTLVLDDRGLQISRITDAAGVELPFAVGPSVEGKGAPLTITIGPGPVTRKITIQYTAAPGAEALQWLDPEQTAGKAQPFLFSQGQAILNRTWIPTQDSPGIRQTWRARIVAPKPLTVVMSGLKQGATEDLGDRRAFTYAMDKPVPPYLIALAAGDIAFRPLGKRTGVWAEPATLDAAAYETADTEKMVEAAEKLYGPYRWGRYDMIVLPPSFPFGGMENPTLTFLTPTFIAGDRSLNGLVAHELAHSWSGNLVTNANWADSWLNEGTTSYFENRIVEALYGTKRARQEAALSYADMMADLTEKGMSDPETALHLPDSLNGPEHGLGGVVYDKGALFYRTVEQVVGRARFDAWLRGWFDSHPFQPATSAMLLADMKANLLGGDTAAAQRLMLDEWIYRPGLPANAARPDPAAFSEVDVAAAEYATTGAPPAGWTGWTTAERVRFMSNVPAKRSAAQLAELDRQLGLSATGNNEVKFLWLKLALANRYEPAIPLAERFLGTVGRTKFVAPLFETLTKQGEWGRAEVKRIYARTRGTYHAVTRNRVDKIVGGPN